jgi:hypothetical protein
MDISSITGSSFGRDHPVEFTDNRYYTFFKVLQEMAKDAE